MKEKLEKVLEFIAVIAAILISTFVVKNISVESILKGSEAPVTLAMTETGLPKDFIGKPAGDDIPRIEDAKTWEDTWQTSYVTIEPIDIISTGIGTRHPWIDTYTSSTRRRGSRRRADVTSTALDVLDEYAEYFILELPDESYILAQMSTDDARKLKTGRKITLPVGQKSPAHSQVLANISELCMEYDVNTDGVFYCIDDKWNEEHNFTVTLVHIGIIVLTTIVISVILIMLIDKVFKEKEVQG